MQNAFTSPSTLLLPAIREKKPNQAAQDVCTQWIGLPLDMVLSDEIVELSGFQLYAVEKWITERTKPIITLVVQTGESDHKIKFSSFKLPTDLPPTQSKRQWDLALHQLKRGGTRPLQTEFGVVFTTSLALFRSDYTIVQIPRGDFLAVRNSLYANITLSRLGCTGTRGGALSLEEPSEATKDRFISIYNLPEFSTYPGHDSSKPENGESLSNTSSNEQKSRNARDEQNAAILPSKSSPSVALSPSPSSIPRTFAPRPSLERSRTDTVQLSTTPSLSLAASSHTSDTTPPDILLPVENSKSPAVFPLLVLELGKLIQAGLKVCGMVKVSSVAPSVGPADRNGSRHSISILPSPLSKPSSKRGSRSSSVSNLESVTTSLNLPSSDPSLSWDIPLDGLLCDVTVQGIQTWIGEIGRPLLGLERMDRAGDPVFLSGLLSLTLATRNKIHALGYSNVPKDPFLQPEAFVRALSAAPTRTHSHSPIPSPLPSPIIPGINNNSSLSVHSSHGYFGSSQSPVISAPTSSHLTVPQSAGHAAPGKTALLPADTAPIRSPPSPVSYLTRSHIQEINTLYSRNASSSDAPAAARKVGRAILGRLDEIQKKGGPDSAASGEEDHAWGTDGGPSGGESYNSEPNTRLGGRIGNLATGLGLSSLAGRTGKATEILEPQLDLDVLIKGIVGKERVWKSRSDRISKRASKSIVGVGASPGQSKDKEREAKEHERDMTLVLSVGGCIRGIWSGRCGNVVVLRMLEDQRCSRGRNDVSKKSETRRRRIPGTRGVSSPASDEDLGDQSDPRSSDPEEGATPFAPWSGRVQRKIESWAKRSRRKPHGSVDLNLSPSKGQLSDAPGDQRTNSHEKRALSVSPTLNPVIHVGLDLEHADSVNLESGVSTEGEKGSRNDSLPRPGKPSGLGLGLPSTLQVQRGSDAQSQKRPWANRLAQARVTSWSDPVSARDVDDDLRGSRTPFGGSSSANQSADVLPESEMSRSLLVVGSYARRRRSFHTLDSLRDVPVLTPNRMKIDVDLAGHFLIMFRRKEHLENLISSLNVLTRDLPSRNSFLRSHVVSHSEAYATAEDRTKIIAAIEAEKTKADADELATNSVLYGSRQFNVPQLYATANTARQRTFAMRESVFGTGGRRVPAGVYGAHGPYNRVQWTLDGRKRLVDAAGRTESEVEEEEELDPTGQFVQGKIDEGEDVTIVRHRALKPVWLLGWFKGLGARWTTIKSPTDGGPHEAEEITRKELMR